MAGAKKLCGTPKCYEVAVQFEPEHMCIKHGGKPAPEPAVVEPATKEVR